jgi:hypothetical protein
VPPLARLVGVDIAATLPGPLGKISEQRLHDDTNNPDSKT